MMKIEENNNLKSEKRLLQKDKISIAVRQEVLEAKRFSLNIQNMEERFLMHKRKHEQIIPPKNTLEDVK